MQAPAPHYREYSPCRALARYVECLWVSFAQPDARKAHRILPDGCIDIIFEPNLPSFRGGRVVGTMTQASLFESSQPTSMIAVRFRPGGAIPFLKIPASEFTDESFELTQCWPKCSWGDLLFNCDSTQSMVVALQRALCQKLSTAGDQDQRVQAAVTLLGHRRLKVDEVTRQLGVTRQHLSRLFLRDVGVTPKTFARVKRLQRLVQDQSSNANWAMAAYRAGYSDQAHMAREFKRLTGLRPTELQRD